MVQNLPNIYILKDPSVLADSGKIPILTKGFGKKSHNLCRPSFDSRLFIATFLQWEIFVVYESTIFKIGAAKKPDKTRSPPVKIGTIFGKLMQSEKCLVLPPQVSCIVVLEASPAVDWEQCNVVLLQDDCCTDTNMLLGENGAYTVQCAVLGPQ